MKKQEFFQLKPVQDSLDRLLQALTHNIGTETIAASQSLGRIIATAPQSAENLPAFDRSAMDGYAVRASNTHGATESLPAYLNLVGEIHMGEVPQLTLGENQAATIHTGAMIPDGATAVVMVERTQKISDTEIEVLAPVAAGENIIKRGEDIQQGSDTLAQGHTIRPQDIGGLLAIGITEIIVFKRPKIAILSSGDELVEAHETPQLGQIRDINSHIIGALCQQAGCEVIQLGIASDNLESMLSLAQEGYNQADMLILSAGSSVSVRDLTSEVINALGEPGIIQHGLAVKPGKPTILASCDGKPVIGLPGNPVSALLVARQIIIPVIRHLAHQKAPAPFTIKATLTQNIASTTGREDSVPVKLTQSGDGTWQATPIWGKSNLIYTLLQADGLVQVPLNTSGYTAGTTINAIGF